jgi:transcription antitermination factor NusG
MSRTAKHWYALYTKPRWEKKVNILLAQQGFESYCPLNKVRKKWSDRLKWVEEPLFKSYVFVKVDEEELKEVRFVDGVVNFVYWLGKPATIKDPEIELIRKFLNEHKDVRVEPIDFNKETEVTIRRGVFMDKDAKVVQVFRNRVQVLIKSIGLSLVVIVEKSNLAVIGKKPIF